jgi:hypothetical protein
MAYQGRMHQRASQDTANRTVTKATNKNLDFDMVISFLIFERGNDDLIQKKVPALAWNRWTRNGTKFHTGQPGISCTLKLDHAGNLSEACVTNSDEINIKLEGQEDVE